MANVLELLTTLDRRLLAALDGLENMQRSVAKIDDMQESVAKLEALGAEGDQLVDDLRERIAALDERLNRDLDRIRDELLDKIGRLDLTDLGDRLSRLESAVFNIEKATVDLDRAVEGTVEALPDFMTKRVREEGQGTAPVATSEEPTA